jgi:hypothetical protein
MKVTNGTIHQELVKVVTRADDAVPLKAWDVSGVTDFASLFDGLTLWVELLQPAEQAWYRSNAFWDDPNHFIGGWVFGPGPINMDRMFSDNVWFNQNISAWNVSPVTRMFSMFHGAERFNQSLHTWTIHHNNIEGMFYGARSFASLLPTFTLAAHCIFSAESIFGESRIATMVGIPRNNRLDTFLANYRQSRSAGTVELRGIYEAANYGLVRPDPTRLGNYELYDKVVDHPDLKHYLAEFHDEFGIARKRPTKKLRTRVLEKAAARKSLQSQSVATRRHSPPGAAPRTPPGLRPGPHL